MPDLLIKKEGLGWVDNKLSEAKFVVAFASGGVSGKRGTRKLRMGTTHAAQVLIYISSVLDLKLSKLRVRGLLWPDGSVLYSI